MKREVEISEISDGRLYRANDLVKADCGGCVGCSDCCRGMGESIILDPLDVYLLVTNLQKSFEELLQNNLELNVVDGMILPNLKMAGKEEACSFLNDEGRCSIHPFRPGICRLFPLGRIYEDEGFQYFLQVHECKKNKSKIKVKKWLGVPELPRHEAYILRWHNFLKSMESLVAQTEDDNWIKTVNMFVLNTFYVKVYDAEKDFYTQIEERIKQAESALKR